MESNAEVNELSSELSRSHFSVCSRSVFLKARYKPKPKILTGTTLAKRLRETALMEDPNSPPPETNKGITQVHEIEGAPPPPIELEQVTTTRNKPPGKGDAKPKVVSKRIKEDGAISTNRQKAKNLKQRNPDEDNTQD
jgi:hypothetical protein